jgi:hypothetical protein
VLTESTSRFRFPGGYRRGKGNGWSLEGHIELIAFTVSDHYTGIGKFSETGTNRGGLQAAEFAQLLDGDGLIQAGQAGRALEPKVQKGAGA